MHALIVDDSRSARAALKKLLGEHQFTCHEASNGKEALEHLQSLDELPDLCLVDWNMPEMDGLELVKAMRAVRRLSEVPIMMVSAESAQANVARALMVGADEYCIKPLHREALVEKLSLLGLLSEAM
ncbi:MAG: PleD family two-component system response regulator [Acidimicrobiales bacterium]